MNQTNKFNSLYKIILNFVIYGLTTIIISNLIIGKKFYNKNSSNKFYEVLKEENYFPSINPYKSVNSLKLNPTNFFSIDKKKLISNNDVFSLDEYGFRNNPYLSDNNKSKKCILILGSSAAFGNGASSDQNTIPSQINKKLGKDFAVYNLAVPSWNSRQELISYLNFLNIELNDKCSEVNTLSFTGTADLNNINFSKKSKLYRYNETRSQLFNSAEQYYILEKKVDFASRFESGIRYKIRTIFLNIFEIAFGNIIEFIHQPKNKIPKNEFSKIDKSFIEEQVDSFIINQKIINNITVNNKGNHLVVLQPNLGNLKNENKIWNYSNKYLSSQISVNCLKILDLRLYLTDKKISFKKNNDEFVISLKDSIKKGFYEENTIKDYYFFDNSHLTDSGYKLISEKIINNLNFNNNELCKEI